MGISHDKIFRLILLAALLFTAPAVKAASDSGVAATLLDVTLPHYRNNELQFILYGERVINYGATVTLYHPLIDIVMRNLPDVEVVTLMKGVRSPDSNLTKITVLNPKQLYPLYTNYKLIREFWAKVPHSQALVSSADAVYNKNRYTFSGDGDVFFRSRHMDADGTGFLVNQKTKTIQIRKNVRVEYRPYAQELNAEAKVLLNKKWNEIKAKNSR